MRKILLMPFLLMLMGVAALTWGGLSYVSAQSGGFTLGWYSVDGGGGKSANGDYAVHGSIGQPDAGLMSGGTYGLQGGFWAGAGIGPNNYQIYLPLVIH